MPPFTEAQARALMEQVLKLSRADACEINLGGGTRGNLRYARNTVTTAGASENVSMTIQSSFGKRSGRVSLNNFEPAALEAAVRRSEELARLAPENPEFVDPLGPQQYGTTPAWFESTAGITPEYRAGVARASIGPARQADATAAGFMEDSAGWQAMMNSRGLFAYHRGTGVDYSVTVRTNDGTGSGYAARSYNDVSQFDAAAVSGIALEKAVASRNPRAIEPGKYTVILEPSAVADLIALLVYSLDARSADEGRSFLAKAGGGTRLGEQLVDPRVSIWSDPANAEVPVAPWTGDGRPRGRTQWIDAGVVKQLYYSRYWAEKQGKEAVPPPGNVLMKGGDQSLEQLIRDTPRGVLVTRLWYIRSVDPQTLLFTGLTRDGTFYVENGAVKHAVKNFRFNESPVIMLNNLDAMGRPVRAVASESGSNFLVPPLRVRDFTFTSLSDAV